MERISAKRKQRLENLLNYLRSVEDNIEEANNAVIELYNEIKLEKRRLNSIRKNHYLHNLQQTMEKQYLPFADDIDQSLYYSFIDNFKSDIIEELSGRY